MPFLRPTISVKALKAQALKAQYHTASYNDNETCKKNENDVPK